MLKFMWNLDRTAEESLVFFLDTLADIFSKQTKESRSSIMFRELSSRLYPKDSLLFLLLTGKFSVNRQSNRSVKLPIELLDFPGKLTILSLLTNSKPKPTLEVGWPLTIEVEKDIWTPNLNWSLEMSILFKKTILKGRFQWLWPWLLFNNLLQDSLKNLFQTITFTLWANQHL